MTFTRPLVAQGRLELPFGAYETPVLPLNYSAIGLSDRTRTCGLDVRTVLHYPLCYGEIGTFDKTRTCILRA